MQVHKLTKEQADWLIKEFNDHDIKSINIVEKIINQYTEKEFPEVVIELGGGYEILIENNNETGIYFATFKDGVAKQNTCDLSFKQFKQFTEGCNKIVQWLKEQE